MFSLILFILNLALVAVVATIFVMKYRAAVGSKWERMLAATQESRTLLWNYMVLFASNLLAWSEKAADVLNLTEVQSVLSKTNPKVVAVAMGVVAVGSIAARLRGLIKQWRESAS